MGLISRVSSRTYRSFHCRPKFFNFKFSSNNKTKMLIYKDPISGDELCSDSYPMELKFNGTIMEVTAAMIKEDGGIDDALIGGNASAEGGDEGGADDTAVTGINVVMNGKLNSTSFGKKDFKTYMGAWFKRMAKWVAENKGEERADAFKRTVWPLLRKSLVASRIGSCTLERTW